MTNEDHHTRYWRKNLRITAALLLVWFLVTFFPTYFARDLNATTFLGFPLGFYMSAQGSLIVYLIIIWFYARYMNRLDARHEASNTNHPSAE